MSDKEPLTVDDLVWVLRNNLDDSIILDKIEIDHAEQKFTVAYREGEESKPKTVDFKVGE